MNQKKKVGPAILYLPHGFASAGWAVALPIMFSTTAMFLYSSRCLLDSWKGENEKAELALRQPEAEEENSGILILDGLNQTEPLLQNGDEYQEEADTTTVTTLAAASQKKRRSIRRAVRQMRLKRHMLSYPELAYRALGPTGETIVKTGIAMMQSGVCLTYLIFVPQNLHYSFLQLFGWDISAEDCLIFMVLVQIPLSWIRDIRRLTPTNLLANCFILYGLITCLGFALKAATTPDAADEADHVGPAEELWHHFKSLKPFAKNWFLFIGTAVSEQKDDAGFVLYQDDL